MTEPRIVIIGAGIGGLTAGALLSKAGASVTVLEAHIYPGGCAGSFYHQGYRFDAGATLAAGFEPGGGMSRLGEALGLEWPVEQAAAAMRVHLPGGASITRWTDAERWRTERRAAFGSDAESFWSWQELTADRLWDLALRGVPWPPQSPSEFARLATSGIELSLRAGLRAPALALDALRPVAAHLRRAPIALRQYVDGQLLIAAQATAERANALYGAAALDMPRRGVAHVRGGVGQIAVQLTDAIRRQGGEVRLKQKVIAVKPGRNGWQIRTNKDAEIEARAVLFNLPPWDAAKLLAGDAPAPLSKAQPPNDGWGAFMLYAGVDKSVLPADAPLHHQVLLREPYGEGASVFISASLPDDTTRAPLGQRAITMSTHTDLRSWWQLFTADRGAYEARKTAYTERVLTTAEAALPGLRGAIHFSMPGTPVSFERFTHRSLGWVGGFPQTSLVRAWGPRLGGGLWLVGDSIFPGQSILATALGGARVAGALLKGMGYSEPASQHGHRSHSNQQLGDVSAKTDAQSLKLQDSKRLGG